MTLSFDRPSALRWGELVLALFNTHCGSDQSDKDKGAPDAAAGGNGSGSGGATSSGGRGGGGRPPVATGGAGCDDCPVGPRGCGLDSAAFCDAFNAPSTTKGRAGELDPEKWSGARGQPQLPTSNGLALGIGPATLPSCRSGLPAQVYPDDDTLICDARNEIKTTHLLVAVGAQNYGQNSYRIRQPFDFGGRTGKIVFDAEAQTEGPLLGWVSVEVTEDPTPAPNFAHGGVTNDEGAPYPRNGFELQFQTSCISPSPAFGLRLMLVYDDYQVTEFEPTDGVCLPTQAGHLNHFEVSVSQQKIEVHATPASPDGLLFDAPTLVYSADVNLPFSRGYVHITTHNHATIKYSENNAMDAWVARWDNVAFDGPIISTWKEHEVPDSLAPGTHAEDPNVAVVSVGYHVADESEGPKDTFQLANVDPAGATSARLALLGWYLSLDGTGLEEYVLKYRFNGGTWRERRFNAGELAFIRSGTFQGALSQMLDVPVGDLVAGNNTLEFVTSNVPQNYPPAVANVDLVLYY